MLVPREAVQYSRCAVFVAAAPIYYVGILCLMQSIIPQIDIQPVPEFPPEPLHDTFERFREMTILFCPTSDETQNVMQRLVWWSCTQVAECDTTASRETMYAHGWVPRVHGFATEADMLEHNRNLALGYSQNSSAVPGSVDGYDPMDRVVGVDFTSLASGDVGYTIRMQQKSTPRLSRWKTPADGAVDANETSTVRSSDLLRTGFVLLEHALNEAIASWQNDRLATKLATLRQSDIDVARFPRQEWHAKYGSDSGGGDGFGLGLLFRLYLPLAFMTSVSLLIVGIVDEKEKKLKEGMRMMGLTEAAYWSSWVISHSAMAIVVVTLSSVLIGKFGTPLIHLVGRFRREVEHFGPICLYVFGRTLPIDRDWLGRRLVAFLQRCAGSAMHDNFSDLL